MKIMSCETDIDQILEVYVVTTITYVKTWRKCMGIEPTCRPLQTAHRI